MSESADLTYYQRNRDVILNRAKDYYENDKERLREQARDKYRNLYKEEKIKRENMEKQISQYASRKERPKEYQKKIIVRIKNVNIIMNKIFF